MIISEQDKKNLIKEYGLIMEHHFEGDKTLEERIKEIDEEYVRILKVGQEFGSEFVNWYTKSVAERDRHMKEDLKKLYNK